MGAVKPGGAFPGSADLPKRPVGRPATEDSRGTLLAATTSAQLKEALQRIADQAATIRRLEHLVRVAERRTELAEASAKAAISRAYGAFAAAGARR